MIAPFLRRWDKARRVRSNDSIPLYSTFFRAYGLHTKVIYLRNSFRFDFKWSELTADPSTTRTVVAGRTEREREKERETREVLGRPSISPRRGKTPGYNEKYAASFEITSFLTGVPLSRGGFVFPLPPRRLFVLSIRSRWSDHASFVTRSIALPRPPRAMV